MLESLREEIEGYLQMLLLLRKNGLTSLFKEVRVFKVKGSKLWDIMQFSSQSESVELSAMNAGTPLKNGV